VSEWLWGVAFALPAVAILLIFLGYPFASIVYHAFTQWNGYSAPTWIGIGNLQALVADPLFQLALRNNLLFAISVPIQLVVPLCLAFLIHQRIPGWRFYRWTYFLPAIYAVVVVGIIARLLLAADGPINAGLQSAGLADLAHDWLADAATAIPAILIVVVWANFGYNVVMYLAGMSAIDPDLPEAARMDGASSWVVLRYIYVPDLRRVMEVVLITSTIVAFASMFTYIYTITNGGPGFSTYVTEFLIYNSAFTFQDMGYASAMGLVLILVISLLGFLQIRLLTGGAGD
jgi:ABC-type sugar transport system permease subunit